MRVAATTKLTFAQTEEIRARAASGERQSAIATEFSVDPSTINKIVRGHRRTKPVALPSVAEVKTRNRARHKNWRDANRGHVRAKGIEMSKARRRREKEAGGHFSTLDVCRQFLAQGGRCFYCAEQIADLSVDHKTPIIRGGGNGPDNIVCACVPCNARKGRLTAEEFLGKDSK